MLMHINPLRLVALPHILYIRSISISKVVNINSNCRYERSHVPTADLFSIVKPMFATTWFACKYLVYYSTVTMFRSLHGREQWRTKKYSPFC